MPEAPLLTREVKIRLAVAAGTAGLVAVCAAAYALPEILNRESGKDEATDPTPTAIAVSDLDLNCVAAPSDYVTVSPDPGEGAIQNFKFNAATPDDTIDGDVAETYTKIRVQILDATQTAETVNTTGTHIFVNGNETSFRQQDALDQDVKALGGSGLYGIVLYDPNLTVSVGCTEQSVATNLAVPSE